MEDGGRRDRSLSEARRALAALAEVLEAQQFLHDQEQGVRDFWADRLGDPACAGHDELEGLAALSDEARVELEDAIARLIELGVVRRPSDAGES